SKRLAELFAKDTTVSWSSAAWRNAVRLSASRGGLVVSGGLRAALRALVHEDEPDLPQDPPPGEQAALGGRRRPIPHRPTFALSEDYFAARAKILGAS